MKNISRAELELFYFLMECVLSEQLDLLPAERDGKDVVLIVGHTEDNTVVLGELMDVGTDVNGVYKFAENASVEELMLFETDEPDEPGEPDETSESGEHNESGETSEPDETNEGKCNGERNKCNNGCKDQYPIDIYPSYIDYTPMIWPCCCDFSF